MNIGATAEFIDQNYQEQNKLLGSQDFQTNIADLNEIVQNAPINKLVSPTQEPVSAPQTVEVPIDSLTIQVPAGGTVNGAVIEAVKQKTGVDMRAVDPSGATDWRLTQQLAQASGYASATDLNLVNPGFTEDFKVSEEAKVVAEEVGVVAAAARQYVQNLPCPGGRTYTGRARVTVHRTARDLSLHGYRVEFRLHSRVTPPVTGRTQGSKDNGG